MASWTRVNTFLLVLAISSLLAILGLLATDVRGGPLDPPGGPGPTDSVKLPGTPISSAPFVISGSGHYYLTNDLVYNGTGAAISFAPHVDYATLDLGGFTVAGFNTGTGIQALGPTPPSQYPLMITNGYVRNFQFGVNVGNAAHARIDNVHVVNNTSNGFTLGNHSVLTNCTAANNGANGIAIPGWFVSVHDCMVADNADSGIQVDGNNNIIEGSQIIRSQWGVRFDAGGRSLVRGNDILEQIANSVYIHDGSSDWSSIYENVLCDVELGTSSGPNTVENNISNVAACGF